MAVGIDEPAAAGAGTAGEDGTDNGTAGESGRMSPAAIAAMYCGCVLDMFGTGVLALAIGAGDSDFICVLRESLDTGAGDDLAVPVPVSEPNFQPEYCHSA